MKYHIRIESEEDGAIIDQEVDAFLVMRRTDIDGISGTHYTALGLNDYELLGWVEWLRIAQGEVMLANTENLSDESLSEET